MVASIPRIRRPARNGRASEATKIVTRTGLLHLDDIGAELAEQRGADGSREKGGEVEHADAGERGGTIGHGPTLLESALQCYWT